MDDEELEKLKERLENSEFNNEDEDLEQMKEKKTKKSKKEKIDSKILIIILCIIIILLLLIIIIGFIPKDKNSKDTKYYENDDNTPSISNVNISKGESYFINDNYLYVVYREKGYITDLDGNVLYEDRNLSCSKTDIGNHYILCEDKKSNNSIKNIVKRIEDNGTIKDVIIENKYDSGGRRLYDEKKNLLGTYTENKKETILYLLNNDSSNMVNINNNYIASSRYNDLNYKTIYNKRYAIITKDINVSNNSIFGIYDVIDNKILISPKYKEISFLQGDYFVAIKNGKYGIIDKNDNVKLNFRYDDIKYSNGLFFAGLNDLLHIFDNNFNEISNTIPYSILEVTPFSNSVIIHKSRYNDEYVVVDKNGIVTNYNFNSFTIYDNYVIALKDNKIILYDSAFSQKQEFDLQGHSIDLDTAAVYLDSSLIFNGRKLFDIESGKYLYDFTNISRSYQNYYVVLNLKDNIVSAVVSLNDNQIGSLENVDLVKFLKSYNNGIKITDKYFIFTNGNKNLIIKK